MRRTALLALAAILLLGGVSFAGWRFFNAPTLLRVAVGPTGSEDARLVAAMSQYLIREGASLRFKVVPVDNEAEAARAVEDEKAELAVVRTDAAMAAKGQTVVVWHRDAVVLVAPADRGIAQPTDLRGHTVGVVKRLAANRQLLDTILAQYDVPRGEVGVVVFETAAEVEAALRTRLVDVVLAVGTVGGRTLEETVSGVATAGGGAPPVFVPLAEAEALAQRSSVFETFDVVRGAFGGAVPRPAETVKTLGVSHRLVALAAVPDGIVSELARLIFVMRPTIATGIPLANRIEAPESSNSAVLPVHPGALAYYDGEVETFFDKYDDYIYIGVMVLSIVGSGLAGMASTASAKRRQRTLGLLERLLGIVRLARAAQTESELDALQHETDEILAVALARAGDGALDDAGVAAFSLGLEQARHAIGDRRRAMSGYRPRLHAAE
ncbi:MAG: TAXI family TRAP transporter solute-binding subunit [Methylobacteriaceae bacterium]|nr:TAXI family TRAP transporter solute-binding subunit [Methylobacteriaceae bacterium]